MLGSVVTVSLRMGAGRVGVGLMAVASGRDVVVVGVGSWSLLQAIKVRARKRARIVCFMPAFCAI
jgi:hypothetical protein